jgi:hypothetical protein
MGDLPADGGCCLRGEAAPSELGQDGDSISAAHTDSVYRNCPIGDRMSPSAPWLTCSGTAHGLLNRSNGSDRRTGSRPPNPMNTIDAKRHRRPSLARHVAIAVVCSTDRSWSVFEVSYALAAGHVPVGRARASGYTTPARHAPTNRRTTTDAC